MKLIEQALKGHKTALVSLANIVVHNHLALCYFLSVQGRVFLVTNTSCCAWINATGQVDVNIKEIPMQKAFTTLARATQSVWSTVTGALLPKLTWFLPFLGPLVAIIALFGICLVNLLVNFVSSRLQ